MAGNYVGEIRIFAGTYAPVGWAFCDGQLLPISENEVLFNYIGTTYGGDGQETFALPDLRGRVPIHKGTDPGGMSYILGENGGVEDVTLTTQQTPIHTHTLLATTTVSTQTSPAGALLAQSSTANIYLQDTGAFALAPSSVSQIGGSQPHTNSQPYLGLNFIISLFGIAPQAA
jgi:microcystin-dependent protein